MTRVKTPTVMQMEVVECGAASLGMVLGYFGRFVSLEELRVRCGVSRDGSSAGDLVRAAEYYGLKGKGGFATAGGIGKKTFPVIILWENCHFMVLEGVQGDRFYVNDPATGPRVIKREDFEKSFSKICLSFEKLENFEPGGEKPKNFRRLVAMAEDIKKPLLLATFISALLLLVGICIPAFSKIFIDYYLIQHLDTWVRPLITIMIITFVLQVALIFIQQSILQKLELYLSVKNNSRFMWHLLRLPCQFFNLRSLGDLISRLQSNCNIAQFLSYTLFTCIIDALQVVVYFVVMLFYSWQLSLVMLVLVFFDVLTYVLSRRINSDRNLHLRMENGKFMGSTMSGLSMLETLKATAGESAFYNKWKGQLVRVINASQTVTFISLLIRNIASFITQLRSVLILGIGGFLVVNGSLTIGGMVAFSALSLAFIRPLQSLISFVTQIQMLKAEIIRVDDVTNYPIDARNEATYEPEKPLSGRVEFKDINFGYRLTQPPLIENFNLTIEPGQRVALVGLSGSGKSTLAKLLSGVFQPWSGDVLLDGKPLAEYSSQVLAHSIATVDQEIFMFEGTLRDNLKLWREHISDTDLMKALELACIDKEVARRPDGLATQVREGGEGFSGGQRQRFEIARALLMRPAILVLDEATSALDPLVEQKIDRNIRQLGASTLIIAHRLSTIRDADKILVLDNGKVVEQGTHESLMAEKGAYYNMMAKVA